MGVAPAGQERKMLLTFEPWKGKLQYVSKKKKISVCNWEPFENQPIRRRYTVGEAKGLNFGHQLLAGWVYLMHKINTMNKVKVKKKKKIFSFKLSNYFMIFYFLTIINALISGFKKKRNVFKFVTLPLFA